MKTLIPQREVGFTLLEVIIVVSLISLILTIASINLFKPTQEASLDTASADVISLMQEAQNKAMNTDTQGDNSSDEFGVHFETQKVTLFKGVVFNSGDQSNFDIDIPSNLNIFTNLLCSSPPEDCNNVVFQRISGEVVGFSDTQNNICITVGSSGKGVLLIVNFVGVINVQDGC